MAKTIRDIGPTQRQVDPELVAQSLGAEKSDVVVNTAQGPISLYSLRQFLVERLRSTGGRPALVGRGTQRNKVPFFANDWERLKILAEYYKEKENIKTNPGQIASILIHLILNRMPDI